MRLSIKLALAGVFFVVACANKSSEDVAARATTHPIIGGVRDDGDPAVVLVMAQDGASGTGWWCTGSVVAKRVVLTAAHCVEEATSSTTMKVMLGTDASAASASNSIEVDSWQHDPQYMATNNIAAGHDAAVLLLKADAPVTPLAINTTPLTDAMVGQSVYVVGFGDDDGAAGTGAGTKRNLHTSLTSLEQGVANIGHAGQTTCFGDSGGPSFMNIGGRSVIVGITSYGAEQCASYGSVTRVDLSASWIQPFLDGSGGGGDGGADDDGGGGGGQPDAGGGGGEPDAGGGGEPDSGGGGGGNDSCVYKCSDYGFSPGQCYQGWYCIPDGELAGCLGQTDC